MIPLKVLDFDSPFSYLQTPSHGHLLLPLVTIKLTDKLSITILSGDGPDALPTLLPPPTKTPLEFVIIDLFLDSSEELAFLLIQLVQAPIEKILN